MDASPGSPHKLHPFAALRQALLFHDGILLIPLAALAACITRIRGVSCGHDFDFHLISWAETQRNWSQGVLYPHWAQSPNWGAGEPRFVFYPPLTWLAGALLAYAMPWPWVPVVFTFLCLAAIGLSTRALARQFLPGPNATLAGVIASAAPYTLFTAYERTAFGELAAAALIPLLLLFTLREPSKLFPVLCSLFPLSVTLAAIWLTNAPAGVMASYLLAFAALTTALLRRQWWPILRAAVAAPIGLGLAAFYLVPAAFEQRWIAIHQAVSVGMRISDSWLFARHASPDLELHDQVLQLASTILVLTTALALAALIVCLIRRKLPASSRPVWLPLALLLPAILLLQFPISAPLWNLLPKLQFLQFPWRWLMVLGTPYAIFLAAATPLASRRSRIGSAIVWIAILAFFIAAASATFFQYCDEGEELPIQVTAQSSSGGQGTDEYAAAGSDNSLIASGLPDACLVSDPTQSLGESDSGPDSGTTPIWYPEQGSCDHTYTAQLWQNEHKLLRIDNDHSGFLVLRLSRYPAWQITVNGKPVASLQSREDGLVVIPVAAGPSVIEVRWSTTPDVWWGRGISLASLLALVAFWIAERRLTAIRLSSSQCP